MTSVPHRWEGGGWLCLSCGKRSPNPCDCVCHGWLTYSRRTLLIGAASVAFTVLGVVVSKSFLLWSMTFGSALALFTWLSIRVVRQNRRERS